MVRALVNMELFDSHLKLLGEEGILPSLLQMLSSGNFESKELSLSALVKLSDCVANRELIAAAGGLPHVIKLMFSAHSRSMIVVKCSEMLEKFCCNDDGIKFFIDENGGQLDLEPIVSNLIALQQIAHPS